MKASIIIPAHNEEKRIADSVRAALTQDYPDFEVIVVDNASGDRTSTNASSFPVKIIREERRGTMWACEAGRRAATGDIIVRLDADCLPDSAWLRTGMKYFENDAVVAVSGPYDYHDGGAIFRYSSLFGQKYMYWLVSGILRLFKAGGIMVGGNSFFRARSLDEVGGFNTDITFYGDEVDTVKRLAPRGRIIYDPSLVMRTSARRFKAEGQLNLLRKYWFHFFKGICSRRK